MHLALPRPHRDDVRIAVGGLLGGLVLWGLGLAMNPGRVLDGAWLLVPLVAMSGLELLRRTRPRTAVLLGTVALIADQFTRGSLATVLMFTDLMYAGALYGPPAMARRLPVVTGLLTVGATLGFLAWWRQPEAVLVGVATGLVSFGPAATGLLVRGHRDRAAAERLRAEQTALLAEVDRAQAVTAERARMARELHDMVANHLSAIAIHSTAALSIDDAATTRGALETIRENSVDGLAEMRRLIGILRDAGGDAEPVAAPTLDGLSALVDQARANGLDAESAVTGSVDGLPAPVELAAYRIVQESLTNALKHASPGPVTVEVDRTGEQVEVRVTSPFGDRDGPRAPGSGAGLVGMRERAALLDGSFSAGPEDSPAGPVWRVRAVLPLTRPAPLEGDLA
ncbi:MULTISPECIES: sensor histidine kinase [Streptomyces]|uniref:histidine kinase n=1 Tax=Streptomyces xanthii TaxID=2768069 RepID=A0A7H1B5U8_9ACTN|nr:histidine kinase [Streptomyces xanthii]QNS04103.1 two-component sensor histidine kinase [Streptomyces xanthii]